MERNFGAGSRKIKHAVKKILWEAFQKKEISGATYGDLQHRFNQFLKFTEDSGYPIKKLEEITRDAVLEYGKHLAEKARMEIISPDYAQCLLSAVNTVMRHTPSNWVPVYAVKECGIQKRSYVRVKTPASLHLDVYRQAQKKLYFMQDEIGVALIRLCRELGLRSKEASLLDCRAAYKEAIKKQQITITHGTKGGRKRIINIFSKSQIEALYFAKNIQENRKSIMPTEKRWKTWRNGGLRRIREAVIGCTGAGLHDLRAAYSCDLYEVLTERKAPVDAKEIPDKIDDMAARKTISAELGHSRIDVVAAYVGGRKPCPK